MLEAHAHQLLLATRLRPLFLATLTALALGIILWPRSVLALPTFAQAYQVDCNTCHTMVPALNAYGRYIQSTAFGALDPSIMKRAFPVVVRESESYRSTGKLNKLDPNLRWTYGNLSANLVGVLNKYVSYRFEQSFYSNNLGGGSTSHFWMSYNQLFKGNGHLVVGKFDTPGGPSAFSYWQDMSGFSMGSITAGQHTYNLTGARWGVGFNYVPIDYQKMPFKAQLAYVGNGNPMFNGSTFDSANPYLTAQSSSGSDKAFVYKVAFARPDNPLEVGVYGASGTYVLAPGYVNPIDQYTSMGAYIQRDPVKGVPGLLLDYQTTNDSNVGPGSPGVGNAASHGLTQGYRSWAYVFEIDESFFDGNVMLGIRPVEFDNGLQSNAKGYDVKNTALPHFGAFDLIVRDPKISPYLWLTAESAVAGASNAQFGGPTWRIGVKWASPVRGPIK